MTGRTLENTTLYDLMAEDFSVWISKNKQFGFNLTIESDSDNPNDRIEISGIHSAAMQCFSDFCRSFVHFYDKLQEDELKENVACLKGV